MKTSDDHFAAESSPEMVEEVARPVGRSLPVTRVVALAFVVGLIGLGFVSRDQFEIDSAVIEAAPIPVEVERARLAESYEVERRFVGRVEARRSSQLGFELGGRVARLTVDEGDVIARGQVLAELDTDRLRARRRSLEARLEQAKADATLAELTRERVREAQELDAVSPQALDEAELGLLARQAAVEQAGSALAELDVEIAKSRLLAPYDGVVAARSVDEGQVLAAGAPVFEIFERGRPEARIGIAGEAVASLAVGQRHRVVVAEHEVEGTVRAVLPVRRPGTRAVEVLFELDAELVHSRADGNATAVHSGDLARLELAQPVAASGFWLPTSALTESSRGLWAVYVVAGDGSEGVVERRELEVLYEEADRVFARGTLRADERFVRGGLHRLVPGQRVRVDSGERS